MSCLQSASEMTAHEPRSACDEDSHRRWV